MCSAEGFPLPTIEWKRISTSGLGTILMNGGNIMIFNVMGSEISVSSTLTFSSTEIMLNGVYTCVARNSVGVSGSPSTTLTVNGEDQCTSLYTL